MRLVVQGKTDNEIGQELCISPHTVRNHLTRIRKETGLRRRSDLPPDAGDGTRRRW